MSDERSQAPSRRRRQQARERGLVARSPELTAAAGLLAAVVWLGVCGRDLAAHFVALVREPLFTDTLNTDRAALIAQLWHQALGLAWPLSTLLAGVAAAILVAHQLQVGGLWVPGLLAPDPGRLWGQGMARGLGVQAERGAWTLARTSIVVAVATVILAHRVSRFHRLSQLDAFQLARAAGALVCDLAFVSAAALLVLGVVDFFIQYRRYEAMLRPTPEQHREDQRADDGDPALRARRRRLAQTWRLDPCELLAGASIAVTSPGGLLVLVGGGPPPRRVRVQMALRGVAADRLRRAAERAGLPVLESPELAQRLTRRRGTGLRLPSTLLAELAAQWPAPHDRRRSPSLPSITM